MASQKIVSFGQKMASRVPALATKYGFQVTAAAKKRQPILEKFWTNARVELAPPGMSDWPAIKTAFSNLRRSTMSGRFLDTSVKDSIANTLVAVEIAMWFYIGEIIGRRSIVGYNV